MYNQNSVISQAIKKYGGADAAYEQKLKEGIRNSMGYSNYINELNAASNKPLSLNLKGDITPSGVKSLVGGAMEMKRQEVGSASRIAGAIDTAAGTLAFAQAVREKAAAKDMEGKFEPKDWLDQQMYNFQVNRPKNEDGTDATVEEFRQQLLKKVAEKDTEGGILSQIQPGINEDMINQRITQRMPEDFNEKRAYYQARLSGATKTESEDLQDYDDYINNKMLEGQKTVYEIQNPITANKIKELGADVALLGEAKEKKEDGSPKYPFSELVTNHPNIKPAQIADAIYPEYKQYAQEEIIDFMNRTEGKESNMDKLRKIYNEEEGLTAVKSSDAYKEIYNILHTLYQGVLTEGEMHSMISTYVFNKVIPSSF